LITPVGAMRMAIEEARKGLGFVGSNPPVGCVILDVNGDLIAKGYHRFFGGDHAEVDALKNVKDAEALNGATLYVTLEPCSHEGKRPSCARQLATLPLKKVVYGLQDPFPLVNGNGLRILREAGFEVEEGPSSLLPELEELAEVFLWNHAHKKSFVSLKVATSLDGQMAHMSGDSKWITGEEAREHGHFLRAVHDAVLVGSGTFLQDNPRLDVRHPRFGGRKNKIIIVDTKSEILRMLPQSKARQVHDPENIFVAVPAGPDHRPQDDEVVEVKAALGARLLKCRTLPSGHVDLANLVTKLYAQGINSIMVEGGARIISSFLIDNLAQRFYQFISPQIIGSRSGLSYSEGLSIAQLSERRELRHPHVLNFGRDIMVTGRLD
jgi:diaminohydroxyphosphoribosylaminopyrimidine deaminase / 5-amino-6-(5-phosphoribosylamino)uracil reductase